jgi:hypothetical protein
MDNKTDNLRINRQLIHLKYKDEVLTLFNKIIEDRGKNNTAIILNVKNIVRIMNNQVNN